MGQRHFDRAGACGFGFGRGGEQVHLLATFGGPGLQGAEGVAGMVEHGGGHARQARHLHAITFAGRAGLQLVQEDDGCARFGGAHMHVDGGGVCGRELGELEVVGGKQRKGLRFVVQVRGDAAGESQAVKGGGAAPDFVHQHQAVGRGAVQDLRGLGHLQHECGLGVGQVVGRTDAGVDRVDGPQAATAGGHMAADAGQQHDECHLAHVGRFAAHVGAGDDLQPLLAAQHRVVGDEAGARHLGQPRLDHGVAALANFDARLFGELGGAPVERQRAFGQGAQHVQAGHGLRQFGERGHKGLQLVEQAFVEPLLAGQGALLCRQGLVFKSLELRRDETFGVFEGLSAAVVVGHFVQLALGDLDVKAVHFVELHAQVGNAGALFFAGLQIQQKRVAVGLDAAQLVQLGVQAIGDHAAVAYQGSGLFEQGHVQKFCAMGGRCEPAGHAGQQAARLRLKGLHLHRQRPRTRQRMAQGHQFARTHLAQRGAGGDALHIARAFELFAQASPCTCAAVAAQNGLGLQAVHGDLAVTRRAEQPAFEQAAAHAGHAGVEQGKQRGRIRSAFAAQGLRQLQVAAGAGGQVNQRVRALHLHALHMRQAAALGVFSISEQGSGGGVRVGQGVGAPGGQRRGLQLLQQLALAQIRVKLKIGPQGE